jgi:hypothetical protein
VVAAATAVAAAVAGVVAKGAGSPLEEGGARRAQRRRVRSAAVMRRGRVRAAGVGAGAGVRVDAVGAGAAVGGVGWLCGEFMGR